MKVEGARAYDLAREGEAFELRARTVSVNRLDIVEIPDADTCVFEADCGRGTYVRAIARDLGRALGCLGHICALERTRVGRLPRGDAATLEDIEAAADAEEPGRLSALLAPCTRRWRTCPKSSCRQPMPRGSGRGQSVLLRGGMHRS